jgi:hypothetical protein
MYTFFARDRYLEVDDSELEVAELAASKAGMV